MEGIREAAQVEEVETGSGDMVGEHMKGDS